MNVQTKGELLIFSNKTFLNNVMKRVSKALDDRFLKKMHNLWYFFYWSLKVRYILNSHTIKVCIPFNQIKTLIAKEYLCSQHTSVLWVLLWYTFGTSVFVSLSMTKRQWRMLIANHLFKGRLSTEHNLFSICSNHLYSSLIYKCMKQFILVKAIYLYVYTWVPIYVKSEHNSQSWFSPSTKLVLRNKVRLLKLV